jgi:F0F1-type ATP synthase assembly protein I
MDDMEDGPKSTEKKNWVKAESYLQLGVTLPAATVIGWLLGLTLDSFLGTHWMYIVGLLLGIAAGFWQLIRIALKSADPGDPK